MRGADDRPSRLFSYVDLEARVPEGHPLRAMRDLVNPALIALDARFAALDKENGRPSIAPERLLRAILLQLFYSIRSERQLMERLDFDLLFRWFVRLGVDDPVWDASTFSKNRTRVLTEEIVQGFLTALLSDRRVKRLFSLFRWAPLSSIWPLLRKRSIWRVRFPSRFCRLSIPHRREKASHRLQS